MKPAEVEDVWRRLRANKKKLVGINLSWTGVPRLTNNSFSVRDQFSVICGENGVGKSTLLHTLLHALVAPHRRNESAVFVRGEEGAIAHVYVELAHGPWGVPRTLVSIDAVRDHFDTETDGLRVALFDPAMHVPIVLNAILSDANFSEVLEPVGSKIYTTGQVADLSYIVGRDYEEVRSFEIEGYAGLGVFPYFKVNAAGVEYGSETMGFGELSLLLGYWTLLRMPRGSIVLLEEPETFVSPRSQKRFVNVAARIALDSELTIVATSHSPSVVSKFKESEITLVSRAGHSVTLVSPVQSSILERRLELVDPVRRVWLVEDVSAARFLSFFLVRCDLLSVSDIIVVGNNDSVVSFSGARAFGDSRVLINGILDGDERSRRGALAKNVDFLPGTVAPEQMLRTFVSAIDHIDLANALGISQAQLVLAKAASAGEEAHQWLHAMRFELGISLDQFVSGALSLWAERNPQELEPFLMRLRIMAGL